MLLPSSLLIMMLLCMQRKKCDGLKEVQNEKGQTDGRRDRDREPDRLAGRQASRQTDR